MREKMCMCEMRKIALRKLKSRTLLDRRITFEPAIGSSLADNADPPCDTDA